MPRGKRTDTAQAVLVRVLADMGFEPGLIASITGLPRGTVKDISRGHGPWTAGTPHNELTEIIKLRVIETIDSLAYGLAMKAMDKLNQKMETASFLELVSAANILGRGDIER